jgi:hypothetical protein
MTRVAGSLQPRDIEALAHWYATPPEGLEMKWHGQLVGAVLGLVADPAALSAC